MKVAIQNTITGNRRFVEIEETTSLIGRPENGRELPAIGINSPLVSRQQARLTHKEGEWTLEHLGSNDTQLGNLVLEPGKYYKVKPGDEIRIAEFVVSLVDDSDAEVQAQLSRLELDAMEFENEVHDQLLERMDLRRGDSASDLQSLESRDQIEEHLDELLESAIQGAAPELLDHILKSHINQRLIWRVTASETDRGAERQLRGEYATLAFEEKLAEILGRIGKECELTFDPADMQIDTERLDERFEAMFEAHRLEISDGLRKYVVMRAIKQDIIDVIYGLGPLQDLMEMDSVSEVMVVARDQIFIEKFGVIEDARRAFFSDELLMSVIERIVAPVGRRIDRSSPLVDAHLPDGSRVNAIIPPLALKGPCVTIRKFSSTPLKMSDLVGFGALSEPMVKFIRACVECEMNIVVSGGTGSGKTTFLNCLSAFISERHRIVTIEDTAELQLDQAHVVTLESRPANMEGKGAITIRDLVKNALRMRPDRVVVGECRGPEALDMLQAMNTGHDGSMTTAHANSPADMMLRLETMVLTAAAMPVSAIRDQIVTAVDIVIQLNRFSDGRRCVTSIAEVVGVDDQDGSIIVEEVFRFQPPSPGRAQGSFIHTGYIPTFIDKLLMKGAVELTDFF